MLDKNLEPKRLKIEIGGKKLDDSRDFKITDDKTPIIINVHIDQFYDEKAEKLHEIKESICPIYKLPLLTKPGYECSPSII